MLVDDYEKYNNDRQDVVDINADEKVEEAEVEPMADDCTLPGFYAPVFSYFSYFCQRSQWTCLATSGPPVKKEHGLTVFDSQMKLSSLGFFLKYQIKRPKARHAIPGILTSGGVLDEKNMGLCSNVAAHPGEFCSSRLATMSTTRLSISNMASTRIHQKAGMRAFSLPSSYGTQVTPLSTLIIPPHIDSTPRRVTGVSPDSSN